MDNVILQYGIMREVFMRSFYEFFKWFWNVCETEPYIDNGHIKDICDTLQKRQLIFEDPNVREIINYNKYNKDIKDILINCCPGSSKSLIVSVMFPLWLWMRNPKLKILSTTYSYSISEQLAAKRLKILQSDQYRDILFGKWDLKSIALQNVTNTMGGQIYFSSIGSAITGLHFNVILVDDPNSPQSIYSESARTEANRYCNEILPTRKTNIKSTYTVYVQQRLHNNDVSSTLIGRKNIKHLIIPAINQNGESFFPARLPISYLKEMKSVLGTESFNAQYLQVTLPDGGGIIKKDWVRFTPSGLTDRSKNDFRFLHNRLHYFVDTSYGGKSSDYNAIIGVYWDPKDSIMRVYSLEINRMEFPQLIKFMKTYIYGGTRVFIEGKASGKSVIQTLKKQTMFNVFELQPKGSKIQRKHAVAPYFEAGRIEFNDDIKFQEELVEQLIFDSTKNDDILDVVMYAVEYFLGSKSRITKFRF